MAHRLRAYDLSQSGAYAAAELELDRSVRLFRRLLDRGVVDVGDDLVVTHVKWEAGTALWRLALVSSALGKLDVATAQGTEAATLMSAELDRLGRRLSLDVGLAVCLTDLSLFCDATGDTDRAVEHAARAVDLLEDRDGDVLTGDADEKLATACHVLAEARLNAGSAAAAVEALNAALAIRERRASAAGPATMAAYELASSLLLHARIDATAGHDEPAAATLTRVSEITLGLGLAGIPLEARVEEIRGRFGL